MPDAQEKIVGINPIEACYRELKNQGRDVIKLFDGNPVEQGFHFPGPCLLEIYEKFFSNPHYNPHPKGTWPARQTLSDYYRSQNIEIDPEHILLTSGTSESFLHLFTYLAQPGDNILSPLPAYPLFDHLASMARISLRPYRLMEEKDWGIDFDYLEKQMDARTKAILVISPNNPTGAVTSLGEWEKLTELAAKHDLAIIHDEVFSAFVGARFPRPRAGAPRPYKTGQPLLFTLNGISKMFALPALKLGWITASGDPKKVDHALDHLETQTDTLLACHTPIQEALPLIFDKGWSFHNSYVEEVGKRKDLAVNRLKTCPKISFVEPKGGFYLMMKIKMDRRISEENFVIRLMQEQDIFIHPGYFYDYEGEDIHAIISFLSKPEKLTEGLSRLIDFVTKL